uniref:Phosphoglycolate phosphatase n=1 Tax=Pyrodinium bahamense TaxID=73915 RepID=A0A7S0FFC0_9DINO
MSQGPALPGLPLPPLLASTMTRSPQHIRAVSLDLDDTLIRSEALKKRILLEIAAEFESGLKVLSGVNTDARVSGVKCTRHTIFRDFAFGLHAAMDLSEAGLAKLHAGPPPEELGKQLAARYSELVEATLADADEVPGAQRLLEHLASQQFPTYINSATPQDALLALVQRRGWTPLVTRTLGSPAAGVDKVDNLRAIAAHADVAPAEILHVGDGDNDANAAARFGCAFVRLRDQPNAATAVVGEILAADMHAAGTIICRWAGLPPLPTAGTKRAASGGLPHGPPPKRPTSP